MRAVVPDAESALSLLFEIPLIALAAVGFDGERDRLTQNDIPALRLPGYHERAVIENHSHAVGQVCAQTGGVPLCLGTGKIDGGERRAAFKKRIGFGRIVGGDSDDLSHDRHGSER